MINSRLYGILSAAWATALLWLIFSNFYWTGTVCLFKIITNLPCPSCGSTRSIIYLLNGDVINSILLNPLGIILTLVLIITPLWICYDLFLKSNSLITFYNSVELNFQRKLFAMPAICLVICNWIWNIQKGL